MNPIWIVSMLLQWALILVLGLLVLSLMRQLGEMAARLNGVPSVPKPEDVYPLFGKLPENSIPLVNGGSFNFGGEQAVPGLLVFLSPTCGACAELTPALREFVRQFPLPGFRVLAVLKQIERPAVAKFLGEQGLENFPVAVETDFPAHLNPGGAPYAVAIAGGGAIAARGKPKTLAHLIEMAQSALNIAHMAPHNSSRSHEWGESAPYWAPEQIAKSQS